MDAGSRVPIAPGTGDVVRSRGWALLRVAIVYQVSLLLLVAPTTGALWRFAVDSATGSAAIVNESLPRLITSPVSLMAIALAALISVSAQRIAVGASTITVLRGSQNAVNAVYAAARHVGALLAIALWQYWRMLVFSLPPVAVAGAAYLLVFGMRGPVGAYARNPQALMWIGGLLGLTLALLLAYLSLRWLLATPVYIGEGLRGRAALNRSRDLTQGRWLRMGAVLVGLVLALVLAGAIVILLLRGAVLGLSGSAGWLAFSLGLDFLLGLALTLVSSVVLQAFVLSRYLDARGEQIPAPRDESVGRLTWLVAGAVLVVGLVVGGFGAVVGAALVAQPVDTTKIEVIAHRAGEAHAPENSLAAVARARQDDADRLEFDVQRTADEQLVVVHDADLVRLSGKDVSIGSSTLEEIQQVDIGEGEHVPTLEQFLVAAGDTPLALEIKTHSGDRQSTSEVVALLKKRDAVDRTVLMSLDPELTALAHDLDPKLRTADLVSVGLGDIYLLPSDVIAPSSANAPAPLVLGAHSAGKEVWVWAVEGETEIRAAVLRGVDGIITSDVPGTRRALNEIANAPASEVARQRIGDLVSMLEE